MFITEEEARRILGPHERRIAAVIDRAWARLKAMPERPSFDLKRTVRTVMHQFMMNELRAEYSGDAAVAYLMEEYETIRLLLERRLVVRIKKMDERGVTRAAETGATLSFLDPEAPLPFAAEDVPPETPSVDMGYVLNNLETRIADKLVAARNGDAVVWCYSFDAEAAATADATLVPAAPAPSSPATIITVPGADAAADRKKTEG